MYFFKKKAIKTDSLQDLLFLSGVIIFSSILVIGLFPGRLDAGLIDENFFITAIMTMPIIAGIYFIVKSFRRSLNIQSPDISESIKKKMTVAFVFIAMISSIPIVMVSSVYLNKNLARMFSRTTMIALDEASELVYDTYRMAGNEVNSELETLDYLFRHFLYPAQDADLESIASIYRKKNFNVIFYKSVNGMQHVAGTTPPQHVINASKFVAFYGMTHSPAIRIDRVKIDGNDIICGMFRYMDIMTVIYRMIPPDIMTKEKLLLKARDEYRRIENQKEYFESGTGSFLMLLSIIILGIAYLVALYISDNITGPVLELSDASKQIALGNNKLFLTRKSNDEIGRLVDTFNMMAAKIEENQKFMFQKQKLEAWNEMARKLVHEIKNPLTPIRLSAERMRKLVIEKSPSMPDVVLRGSETIVNEVNRLLGLVGEFSSFARMPVKNVEMSDIGVIIRETVALFIGYENVEFRVMHGTGIPDIMIDRNLIRQALNNLINNAIQAIAENGVIEIKTAPDDTGLYVAVSIVDSGPGIEEENLEKIFEPGFTLRKAGTGLGLAIVEKIIFDHEGKIFCRSEPGRGTEFILMLPVPYGEK